MRDEPMNETMTRTAPYKVDVSRGGHNGALNAQWAGRPDDQRFTTMNDLRAAVYARAERSEEAEMSTALDFHFGTKFGEDEEGRSTKYLDIRAGDHIVTPTNWAFGQMASVVGIKADVLNTMPPALAATNMRWGFTNRAEHVKALELRENGDRELRAITSPSYGRVWDHQLVDWIADVCEKSGLDWKVPGELNWGTRHYDPEVPTTLQNTTLYASDRDVWGFLCDDRNPIQVGLLSDGSPDLVFRGFYFWNSEVGKTSLGLATMLLRGVCMNRNLWGVQGFKEVRINHSANAGKRLVSDLAPLLSDYVQSSASEAQAAIGEAQKATVGKNDEEVADFMVASGFGRRAAVDMISDHLRLEGKPARSRWDVAQAATAYARRFPHQDKRIGLELLAGRVLEDVEHSATVVLTD